MPTNVPVPVYGPRGFVIPDEVDVLDGRQADIDQAMGGGLNPGLSTPQGQMASSDSAIIGDVHAFFAWLTNQVDPAFAEGRMQDAIARISYISRIPARSTVVTATCVGLVDVVIPIGALAQAEDNNRYVCIASGTIPVGGSIDLPFACVTSGPIECPAHSLNRIAQHVPGWDTIDNAAAGALGNTVESRANFEERRRDAVGWQSTGSLGAILGAVLNVDGVLDAYVAQNERGYYRTFNGVSLNANSVYVCVLGGTDEDIARAIWSRKPPGVATVGSTVVTIDDPNPVYANNGPTYEVRFQRPTFVPIFMHVLLKRASDVPTNAQELIADAILTLFSGEGDGPRERIGGTIYASRYYDVVNDLGTWAQRIISINLGIAQHTQFTASISGAVMNVTAVASGTIAMGLVLRDDTGLVDGVRVIEFDSGTGGIGTYVVTATQLVTSRTMRGYFTQEAVQLNIDQAPTLASDDVVVSFE